MPRPFKAYWLGIKVAGETIQEWCQKIETEHVFCKYCKFSIKFSSSGLKALKNHAVAERHRQNRAAELRKCKTVANKDHQLKLSSHPLGLYDQSLSEQAQNVVFSSWSGLGLSRCYINVYICYYCGEEFPSRCVLQTHQLACNMKTPLDSKPPSLQTAKLPLLDETLVTNFTKIHQPSAVFYDLAPSKEEYISALELIPKSKTEVIARRRRNTECETIDLEDLPVSPTVPRTPKRLLSHLSRDESSSSCTYRRRLSLSFQTKNEKENVDAKKDLTNPEEKRDEKPKLASVKSLYNLDLTSPLGQCVSRHIKGDPNLHVLSDVESHCLTSTPKKSLVDLKLRERPVNYLVTFKGYPSKLPYIHQYKFNQLEKKEFLRRVNTGLDKKSRRLARKMKPCRVLLRPVTKADLKQWIPSQNEITVDLKPLTADEISFWTKPKTPISVLAEFPSGLTFSSPNVSNVLGLRTRQDVSLLKSPGLSVSNYVSEETLAEVTANRVAVYKSLLADTSCGEIENLPTPRVSVRRVFIPFGDAHKTCFLPDITNLKVKEGTESNTRENGLVQIRCAKEGEKIAILKRREINNANVLREIPGQPKPQGQHVFKRERHSKRNLLHTVHSGKREKPHDNLVAGQQKLPECHTQNSNTLEPLSVNKVSSKVLAPWSANAVKLSPPRGKLLGQSPFSYVNTKPSTMASSKNAKLSSFKDNSCKTLSKYKSCPSLRSNKQLTNVRAPVIVKKSSEKKLHNILLRSSKKSASANADMNMPSKEMMQVRKFSLRPELRKSSMRKRISILQRAEERKRILSSFLLYSSKIKSRN
ncbi:uncharacterized protein LOC131949805 isoform X2 [Physella acuta]|uniref:uncharacterized protein LOC131949805 isoform X2 n=1 Tax=Physella acuta TaxID=109671 RepID=UPI0027DDEABD|nr:uncharacterized protein LOC131949805 isoform X2 [Physella acuta]